MAECENWRAAGDSVVKGGMLCSDTSAYTIKGFIGEGAFGKVAKCLRLSNQQQIVAVKMFEEDDLEGAERELDVLKAISALDPDRTNLVRFYEHFFDMGQSCLVFEKLHMNLLTFLNRKGRPLLANEIRPIAKQMLVALEALKGLGILHGDVKPDNIMLVDAVKQPFRVKLIDFGIGGPVSEVQLGETIQTMGYRAPEVCLGLPFHEAIDVWGLGCTLATLLLAQHVFPTSDHQMMSFLVQIVGQPTDQQLRDGMYSQDFFTEEATADGPRWRLRTPSECSGIPEEPKWSPDCFDRMTCLRDLAHVHPCQDAAELTDRLALIDLLEGMLHLDGDQRVTPREALEDPFITMSHLVQDPAHSQHLIQSQALMRVCAGGTSTERRGIRNVGPRELCGFRGLCGPGGLYDPRDWVALEDCVAAEECVDLEDCVTPEDWVALEECVALEDWWLQCSDVVSGGGS